MPYIRRTNRDTVVLKGTRTPIYVGKPKAILWWLEKYKDRHDTVEIYVGKERIFMSVSDYISRHNPKTR